MITGNKKVHLVAESILDKISDYDIFRFYMPNKSWNLNQVTYSPFRKENNPSFIIGDRKGYISFIDFADTSKRGDCFKFVMELYNISFYDALVMIDKDFGLGIKDGTCTKSYEKIVSQYKQPEIVKRSAIIQVSVKKFTNKDLEYWNQYHQSIDDLKANNVYSVNKVYLNKQLFYTKEDDLVFGYLYGEHWKIYRPFGDKKNKWVPNNVPLVTTKGLENLRPNENTLICKSLKDYMVCRKIYSNVCHVQNESLSAFSNETVEFINENSKDVFYGGDSDKPGKEASYAITNIFGFKHINSPDRLLPDAKDFADWARLEGLQELENHFVQKRLFGSLK
jgi:hypothetical protein